MFFTIENSFRRIAIMILITIGVILIAISSFISWFKALNDKDVDKLAMVMGFYIFKYPKLLILAIIGLILILIGSNL